MKKEISVLTWQAKEQIRFLNQEYPEEWTVEKLTESFPVSRSGVLDVLKSSYIPRDEKEIKKHDIKALRNIQDIKERLENESQLMDPDEKESLEDKIEKIGNASGIKSLPLTQLVTRRSIAAQSKLLRPSNKIGPFQSMLMYYDRIVDGDQQIQDKKYAILSENTEKENERIDDGKSRGAKPIENLIDQPYSTKAENSGIRKQLYSDTSGRFNRHQTDNRERLDSPTNDKIFNNYEMHENESSTSRRTNKYVNNFVLQEEKRLPSHRNEKTMNNFEMPEEQRFSASSMHENGRSTSRRTTKNVNNFVLHKERKLPSKNEKTINNFEMQEEQRFSASSMHENGRSTSRRTNKNVNNFVLHKDRRLPSPGNEKTMNNFEMQEEQRFSASSKNERSIESSRRHRMDGLNKRKDIFTSTSQATNSNNNKLNAVQNENFDFIPEDGQKIQKWNTEPEMYSSDTFGKTVTMQKPYIEISGRHSGKFNEGIVEQIKVPKRHKASFYKKGKIMYDDEGDFLYKIP